jgi:hypothetical protein
MRTITNNYRDAQILNLASGGESGPYPVTQTGVSPRAEIPKTHMYVLRPDGQWVDFNAYVCQGKPEAMDEIVFPTVAKVMETFARLTGRPQVLDLPSIRRDLRRGLLVKRAATQWRRRKRGRLTTRNVTGRRNNPSLAKQPL